MLPIKLTIQGINSYQNEQVIEFDNLLKSKIFGIFGEVGSGKSTILEAISYVLYGQMEKMNKSDKINYNFMNLKSNRFVIDFEFKAESEKKYRFIVEGRRNSKQFEDVKIKRKYYEWISDDWMPNENLKAEKIIGLSYENFKRTIIIPQGKFMEFIQLNNADRTKMLKEIFNLQKYDLQDKVGRLQRKNAEDIANLKGKLSQLIDVSESIVKENKVELKNISALRKKLEKDLAGKEYEFKELDTNRALFKNLNEKTKRFERLNSYKSAFEQKEKELVEFELCLLNFAPLMDNLLSIEEKIISKKSELKELKRNETILNEQIEKSKQRFAIISEKYKGLDDLKKKNEELEKVVSLKSIEEEIVKSTTLLESENKANNNLILQKEKTEKELFELNDKLKSIDDNSIKLSELTSVKEWVVKEQGLKQIINELKTELNNKQRRGEQLIAKSIEVISREDKVVLNFVKSLNIEESIKFLDAKLTNFIQGIKALQKEREELLVKDKLKNYANSLKPGVACPVCGSTEHPNQINIEHVSKDISRLNERISKGEVFIERIRQYLDRFKLLKSNKDSESQIIEEVKLKLEGKEKELLEFGESFTWAKHKGKSLENLIAEIKEENELVEKRKKFHLEYSKLLKSSTEIQKKLDVSIANLAKANEALTTFLSKQDLLIKQLKIVNFSEFISKSSVEVKSMMIELAEEINSIEKDFEAIGEELKSFELNLKGVEGKIEGIEKLLKEQEEDHHEIKTKLNSKIAELGFGDIGSISIILGKSIDIGLVKKEISDFKISFETTKNEIAELKSKLEGKVFDESKFNILIEEIEKSKKEISNYDNEIGRLKSAIEKLELRLKEQEKYKTLLAEQELRSEDLKLMKSLFMSNGFVNYISTVRLEEVVNYANDRFIKLTRGSMKLVLNEANSFNVIDFLNGGKQRSIKTLSGGQTFQASLSLALALASIVQQQNMQKQNFFFLDEGFGTQDDESLRLVFNTIKSLRKENRVIGLISHVAELKEEISTYLEVINDEQEGSRIISSW